MPNIKLHKALFLAFALVNPFVTFSQDTNPQNRWRIVNEKAIVWDVHNESQLPHSDDIEVAGQKVASIIKYEVNEQKRLEVTRDLIFPQLRRFVRTSEPDWFEYRNYLRYQYTDEFLPVIIAADQILDPTLDSVRIDGKLNFYHTPENGIQIIRSFFPSMTERSLVEKITLVNMGADERNIFIGNKEFAHHEKGLHGGYTISIFSDAEENISLQLGESYSFGVYYTAAMNTEPRVQQNFAGAEKQRDDFLDYVQQNLLLTTPDPVINTLFYFSKIRAAENIFDTKMGLVHSPGGGNYYAGIWANDQVEYSGPFFPYLGYEIGNTAALNAYLHFLKNIPPEGEFIKSSFEMEGDLPCCSKDRGDAAMIAYGTSQFVLALGDKVTAEKLWPLIEWSLEYNHGKLNEHGVVLSDTDEMEGRIPTGEANLSSSSLYYGGLINAVKVAEMLGKPRRMIREYQKRASDLEKAIENHFGATIDGIETYRYYEGHETFRHWICLPLVMGIDTRLEGTLTALFDKLWTDNGILVDPDQNVLWDRGTLYAFRGAFMAGAADRALERLLPFSQTRLLGNRVPYVVEAYPEYGMRHLSAESALYARVFTEGMLGIVPLATNKFELTPNIPTGWNTLKIGKMHILQTVIDIEVIRTGNQFQIKIFNNGELINQYQVNNGETMVVELK